MKTGKEFVEHYPSMFTEDKEWWAKTLDDHFNYDGVTYKDEKIDYLEALNKSYESEIEHKNSQLLQAEKQRDHYKALYEAVEKLVDKNGWGNEAEWLQYQSLKIQTP